MVIMGGLIMIRDCAVYVQLEVKLISYNSFVHLSVW